MRRRSSLKAESLHQAGVEAFSGTHHEYKNFTLLFDNLKDNAVAGAVIREHILFEFPQGAA